MSEQRITLVLGATEYRGTMLGEVGGVLVQFGSFSRWRQSEPSRSTETARNVVHELVVLHNELKPKAEEQ